MLRVRIVDVFAAERFCGNPLAVVFGAETLGDADLLGLTREFGFSETSFVVAAQGPDAVARVRIFNRHGEAAFGGHPNVGAVFAMALEGWPGVRRGPVAIEQVIGDLKVELTEQAGEPWGARLTMPRRFSKGVSCGVPEVAAMLMLDPSDIALVRHPPVVASLGLAHLIVELTSREALARARPDEARCARHLPLGGAEAIYCYVVPPLDGPGRADIVARRFAPFDHHKEEPATGGAAAAVATLIDHALPVPPPGPRRYWIAQGRETGRPSRIGVVVGFPDDPARVDLFGPCRAVMAGQIAW